MTKSNNYEVVLIESETFVGGISRTAVYKGNRMDIGGHRFFTKDDRVNALWKTLLPLQGAPAKDDLLLGREKPLEKNGPDPEQTVCSKSSTIYGDQLLKICILPRRTSRSCTYIQQSGTISPTVLSLVLFLTCILSRSKPTVIKSR